VAKLFTEDEVVGLAREAYDHGDAAFELEADRAALLVVDMQDEFVRPGWTPYWVPDATRQVPRIRTLLLACRRLDVPVIYTVFSATHRDLDRPASGSTMPNRYPTVPNDPAWFRDGVVWHELAPRDEEIIIHKPSYGAFFDTPLQTILGNLGRDTIIVCGTLTNYCCGSTARQGYERGFKVVLGSDVCGTDDPVANDAELRTLRRGFARVLTSEAIIAALEATRQQAVGRT
jgi:nicotinamidase-related amidase